MADIFNLSDTWNDGATTFSAIKMDVTDTASASGSLLMDLQVGGASRFGVLKDGSTVIPTTKAYAFATSGAYSVGLYNNANYAASIAMSSLAPGGSFSAYRGFEFELTGPTLSMGLSTLDVKLTRDAADTLAQRRSTNPQAFRISNTHTDSSNYERGKIAWESNVLRIGTEKAGTGSARALELQTDGTSSIRISATGLVQISEKFAFSNSGFTSRSIIASTASGLLTLLNNAESDFSRLMFGGTTSSFPALKRSTTALQARLADDSDYTAIQGKITTETAYTAGAPTATGYIVLYDSTGTAYKVPAEAL